VWFLQIFAYLINLTINVYGKTSETKSAIIAGVKDVEDEGNTNDGRKTNVTW